jgi:hypothetical protein
MAEEIKLKIVTKERFNISRTGKTTIPLGRSRRSHEDPSKKYTSEVDIREPTIHDSEVNFSTTESSS